MDPITPFRGRIETSHRVLHIFRFMDIKAGARSPRLEVFNGGDKVRLIRMS